VLAVLWMVASVVTIAVFIAGITSALTTQRLLGVVRNENDLRSVRVGAVAGSSTVDFLTEQRIAFRPYPTAADGLRAVQSEQTDAFVYDRPLLAWMLQQDFPRLELTPVTLDNQNYAFALALNSPIRAELDVGCSTRCAVDGGRRRGSAISASTRPTEQIASFDEGTAARPPAGREAPGVGSLRAA